MSRGEDAAGIGPTPAETRASARPLALVVGELPAAHRRLDSELALHAVSAEGAIAALERERPDLLLLDGRLPGHELEQVVEHVLRPGRADRPGVILVSAGSSGPSLLAQADELVEGGLGPEALLARVRSTLRVRELRRELADKSAEIESLSARLEGISGRMAEELRIASHVQRTLLPPPLVHPRLELAAEYLPVREIGGDYYDVIPLEGGRLALALGDVMGKGVPAALLAANLKSCLRAHVQAGQPSAAETLVRVNRLFREVIPKGMFATLLFAVLDWAHGQLEYVNAGHEPGLLLRRDGALVELGCGGTVLGLLEEPGYETTRERIETDDVLVLFSDGLTDRSAANGEMFGRGRLRAAAGRVRRDPARIALYSVLGEVQGWSGGRPAEDDQTLIIARLR